MLQARISVESNFFWRKQVNRFKGLSTAILTLKTSWQAQYLVKLGADTCCSAHCK